LLHCMNCLDMVLENFFTRNQPSYHHLTANKSLLSISQMRLGAVSLERSHLSMRNARLIASRSFYPSSRMYKKLSCPSTHLKRDGTSFTSVGLTLSLVALEDWNTMTSSIKNGFRLILVHPTLF
jgi:hypothetical protein